MVQFAHKSQNVLSFWAEDHAGKDVYVGGKTQQNI